MQITSGDLKRKKLSFSSSLCIRPTSEKVRSAIFDIIRPKIKKSKFLDLFAGTGAVGIQALSEGASLSCFVEENWKCINVIKKNLKELYFLDKAIVVRKSVERFVREDKDLFKDFDFLFLDPPYNYADNKYNLLLEELVDCLKNGAIVIIEHSSRRLGDNFFLKYEFVNYRLKRYGDTTLTILCRTDSEKER